MGWRTVMGAPLHVVVLAAGKGTRMRSDLPKVLQPLGGAPMITQVLDRARSLRAAAITVVVGHEAARVRAAVAAPDLRFVEQLRQNGTGHAVHLALSGQDPAARVLVLYGDVPLVPVEDLEACIAVDDRLLILGAEVSDPSGYGRLIEEPEGGLERIVEERDADAATLAVRRVNTGILCAGAGDLQRWLAKGEGAASRRAGEWYLTDVVGEARAESLPVTLVMSRRPEAVLGVNDRIQLAQQERLLQRLRAEDLMRCGLQIADPSRIDIRGTLTFGSDCLLDANVLIEGEVQFGARVRVGPGCCIRDSRLEADAVIEAYSVLDGCSVGAGARVGPFARLRPGSRLDEGSRVGNFVEMKNTTLGPGAKANHLTYLGDAQVGARTNIGAGTITCNYDGVAKHHTEIGSDAFIGSNSALVAPVSIGERATIGAGTVLTRDAPADRLTLARVPQATVEDWERPGSAAVRRED